MAKQFINYSILFKAALKSVALIITNEKYYEEKSHEKEYFILKVANCCYLLNSLANIFC